ncbi:10630_t:CDS:2, partial [Ambispora gerdemannii]
TGLISQAVWYNDPKIVSQPCSANSLFEEAILRLAEEKPHLIFETEIEYKKKLIEGLYKKPVNKLLRE